MNESVFWKIIEETRCSAECQQDVHAEKLRLCLGRLEKADLANFVRLFVSKVYSLENWDVWAVAWISRYSDGNFGCGDDAFHTFRTSIILHGKAFYELAIEDPDSLSIYGFIGEFKSLDYLSHIPKIVYSDLYGDLPFNPYEPEEPGPMEGYEWGEDELSYFNSSFLSKISSKMGRAGITKMKCEFVVNDRMDF